MRLKKVNVSLKYGYVLIVTASLLVTGCSSGSSSGMDSNTEYSNSEMALSGVTIIDVRTPAEFSEGHLDGAVNISVESPDFVSNIESMDISGSYLVYCRSGNRSATAVKIMKDLGFTTLVDAGSVAEASDYLDREVVK